MPCRLTETPDYLLVEYYGVVTPGCLLDASRIMERFEKAHEHSLHRLCTLTGVTQFAIDFGVVLQTAERRRKFRLSRRIRDAIVVSGDLQLGFARMYQQVIEHPQIDFRIFEDRQEAEAWLRAVEA